MELETKKISLKVVVVFTDKAVFSQTGKHLSNIESLVLQETLNGKKYPEIASANGYTIEYLKNDVGPKLWRRLSFAFGEKVNKSNVKIIITNRLYNEQEKTKSIPIKPSVINQQPSLVPALHLKASSLDAKVEQLEKIADLYCEKSLKTLRETPAHKILMILIMFPHGALKEAIMKVAELSHIDILDDSITQLQEMLLIEQKEQRYYLNPVIKNYLKTELITYREFEKSSRKRWLSWYLEIAEKNQTLFICDKEKQNIIEVIDWCMNHNLYEQVKKLWPILKSQELEPQVDNTFCVNYPN
ncbi:MAG: hypothetical protein QNJ42_25460 [Crocosphaera sp.]|nr:hypothetical protein [Crocosphaera sp.]